MKVKPEVFVFFAYNKRQTLTPLFIYLFIYLFIFYRLGALHTSPVMATTT